MPRYQANRCAIIRVCLEFQTEVEHVFRETATLNITVGPKFSTIPSTATSSPMQLMLAAPLMEAFKRVKYANTISAFKHVRFFLGSADLKYCEQPISPFAVAFFNQKADTSLNANWQTVCPNILYTWLTCNVGTVISFKIALSGINPAHLRNPNTDLHRLFRACPWLSAADGSDDAGAERRLANLPALDALHRECLGGFRWLDERQRELFAQAMACLYLREMSYNGRGGRRGLGGRVWVADYEMRERRVWATDSVLELYENMEGLDDGRGVWLVSGDDAL